ncbi:MAG: hypothetical protein B6I28_01080 [Fusobacteriia bacterium 4572_132]|nr:MAG: hypothetical protein B6I28_01080 [Fusobacteriia bacterium 4572_132]
MKKENIENYNQKPLGIFGAKASGKTTFFTTLYGLSGFNKKDESFSVICNDDVSRNYLKGNYKALLNGKLPARTEINNSTEINMSYFYNKSNYHLKSYDFAGELIKDVMENSEEMGSEFFQSQKNIYDFFSQCSAILFFLEPETKNGETFERQIEIDKLLGFLKEKDQKWQLDIPMALVVTKWDKISDLTGKYDYEKEKEKVKNYIKEHRVYNNIYTLISGVAPSTEIFPVSAFGDSKRGDLPPDELKPFNLFSPLMWASQKRDVEWKKKIIEMIKENKNSKKIGKAVKAFLKDVSNKEMIEEVEEKYKKYKKIKRIKKTVMTVLSVIVLVSAIGYNEYQKNKRQNYYTEAIAEKNSKIKLEKIDGFLNIYEKPERIINELKNRRIEIQNEMIENEKNTVNKINLINEFIKKDLSEESKNNLLNTKNKILKREKKKKEYNELISKIEEETREYEKYLIIKRFLDKNKENDYKKELEEREKMYLKLADRKKYEEINNMQDEGYEKVFEKIEEYFAIQEFTEYKKEVEEIKANVKDAYLFSNVEKAVKNYNQNKKLKLIDEVIQKSEGYLSNNVLGRNEKRVENILNQIKLIKKGKKAEMEFFISSKDTREFQNKRILMSVNINGKSIDKKKMGSKGKEIYLGNINNVLNFQTKVKVTLYTTDKNGDEEKFVIDNYNFEMINKPKKVKTGNNKEIYFKIKTDKTKFEIN